MSIKGVILGTLAAATPIFTAAIITQAVSKPKPAPTAVTAKAVETRTGTAGDSLPVPYDDWWLKSTDNVAIIINLEDSNKFRTNLIWLYEGRIKFEVVAITFEGKRIGSLTYDTADTEQPVSIYQINRFVKQINSSYSGKYNVQIFPISGEGRVFFYATVIDNLSNDYTMYTHFRYSGTEVWSESGHYGSQKEQIQPITDPWIPPTPRPIPTKNPFDPVN